MNPSPAASNADLTRFRLRLLFAMMLVVSLITAAVLYFAQRQLAASVQQDLERQFQSKVTFLHDVHELRLAVLAERCRTLAQKPRIHAALEDNALDFLYPSASDELQDLMGDGEHGRLLAQSLRATFYRFLDQTGAVIPAPRRQGVAALTPQEEAHLNFGRLPTEQQSGYVQRGQGETIDEVIAVPIVSSETNQPIAALVVGFQPVQSGAQDHAAGIQSGLWLNGHLHISSSANLQPAAFEDSVTTAINSRASAEQRLRVEVNHVPHLIFYELLNPASLLPPAYGVSIYPLTDLSARERRLRWQILSAGAVMLSAGFGASYFASARLSQPIEELAVDAAANRSERYRAEAALEKTSRDLQRSARFSANTSHQLKTPITVLRAGLEELRSKENLTSVARKEISALIHQTFRITNIVEDLLLLSQMDAGRLQIDFRSVNLTHLLETQIDDLSALPDEIEVESDCPKMQITGESRYVSLILQNLFENARKYNRRGGRIRVACREQGEWALLIIGNTGRAIPLEAQEHIFERFHRGLVGEDITGHGLGLNIARELARLHGGDLRLLSSDHLWTEFELRLRLASRAVTSADGV